MFTINNALSRSAAIVLALALAWPLPAWALKVQAPAENGGLEELTAWLAGMEEPPLSSEPTRREFLKTLAALAQLSTRLGALADALTPAPSSVPPVWEPYREALPLAFDELGLATEGNREVILQLMLDREAKNAGILIDPAMSAVNLADSLSAASFPEAQHLAATYVQWGEILQQRLETPGRRAALIQQLREGVGAEIGRLQSEGVQRRYKAETRRELWPLPEYRTLARMLETLTEPQIAEGLVWAAGQHLQVVKTAIEHLSAAAADPAAQTRLDRLARERQRLAQARRGWMEPSTEDISRAVEQFRVVPAPSFRRLEGSVVGFYVDGDGVRFARPLALAIAQAPAGVATLAGMVPTEADKAALVESLAAAPAAQTLVADGVVTLEQIPTEREAREEAFRRLHTRGATYSHWITADHDDDPVAYLQRLLFQFGVTLPPDPAHPGELAPAVHAAALALLRAAPAAGMEEPPPTAGWGRPRSRREFLEQSGKTLAAWSRLGRLIGALSEQFLAGAPTAPTPPAWDAYRPALHGVVQDMVHYGNNPAGGWAKIPWVWAADVEMLPQPGESPESSRGRWDAAIGMHRVMEHHIRQHVGIGRAMLAQLKGTDGGMAALRRLEQQAEPQGIRAWIAKRLHVKDEARIDKVLELAGRSDPQADAEWASDARLANLAELARSRINGARQLTTLTQHLSDKELIEGLRWAHGDYLRTAQAETQTIERQIATLREVGALVIPELGARAIPPDTAPPLETGTRQPTDQLLRRVRERGGSLTSEEARVVLAAQAAGANDVLLLERPGVAAGTTVTLCAAREVLAWLASRVPQWPAWPSAETAVAFTVQAPPAAGVVPHAVAVRLASQPRVEGMPNLVVDSPEALERVTAALVATVAFAALPSADQDLPVVAVLPLTIDGREVLALFL